MITMHIMFKHNSDTQNRIADRDQQEKNKAIAERGDVIHATLTGKDQESVTLLTDDNVVLTADAGSVTGETGDEITFLVMDTDGALTLKQIVNENARSADNEAKPRQKGNAAELFKQSGKANGTAAEKYAAEPIKTEKEIQQAEAIKELKRKLEYTGRNASHASAERLLDTGISADKMEFEMLSAVINEQEQDEGRTDLHKERSVERRTPRKADIKLSDGKLEPKKTDVRHNDTRHEWKKVDTGRTIGQKPQENANLRDDILKERATEALKKHDLTVSPDNIRTLEAVVKKIDQGHKMDDKAALLLLSGEESITPDNIYMSKYTAKHVHAPKLMDEETWNSLLPEIERVFKQEGIESDEKSYAVAKLFVEYGIPVSKQNIEKYNFLKSLEEKTDTEELLNNAAEDIKRGVDPSDRDIYELMANERYPKVHTDNLPEKYNNIIKKLPEISDETVRVLLRKRIPLNLANLTNPTATTDTSENGTPAIRNTEKEKMASHENIVNEVHTGDTDNQDENVRLNVIKARRQLAEIALKLTHEAARRLAGKGLDISTQPLEEAVESLKELEKEGYAKNLRIMGAEATQENIVRMTELYDRLSEINPITNNVYGDIVSKKIGFRLSSIHAAAVEARDTETRDRVINEEEPSTEPVTELNTERRVVAFRTVNTDLQSITARTKAIAVYERFETVPNPKYGDSFNKVKDQFKDFLAGLEIEPNDANIKAASILSRNDMEVNEENILSIKIIDAKISAVYDRLHPNIAASMVRDGFNALDAHVDEVLEYIDKFDDVYGTNLGERMAEYIMEMDSNNTVTSDERDAVIAIYRMLNMVQKNGSVALGVTMKNKTELTMNNLLEASRYYGRTKARREDVDVRVDNSFGRLESVTTPERNIKKLINNAYGRSISNMELSRAEAEHVLDRHNMGHTSENLSILEDMVSEGLEIDNRLLDELVYNREIIETLSRTAVPAAVTKLVGNKQDILNMPLTELIDKLQAAIQNSDYSDYAVNKYIERLQDIVRSSPAAIHWLQSNNVSTSMQNVLLMSGIVRNPNFIKDEVHKLDDSIIERLEDEAGIPDSSLTSFIEGASAEDVLNETAEKINDMAEAIDEIESRQQTAVALKRICHAVRLQGRISNGSDRQGLLIKLNGRISSLNIYFLNESKNTSNALLTLTTNNSGNIQGLLNIEKDSVTVRLSANEDVQELLKTNSAELESRLASEGITLNGLRFGGGELKANPYPSAAGGARMDNFYKIVSAVVGYIEYTDGITGLQKG